jgi:hypothetical protein
MSSLTPTSTTVNKSIETLCSKVVSTSTDITYHTSRDNFDYVVLSVVKHILSKHSYIRLYNRSHNGISKFEFNDSIYVTKISTLSASQGLLEFERKGRRTIRVCSNELNQIKNIQNWVFTMCRRDGWLHKKEIPIPIPIPTSNQIE